MAATEEAIKKEMHPSLQFTLFRTLRDAKSNSPGPDKCEDYNNAYLANLASELLWHAGYGRQDEAETIIKEYPDVLLYRPSRSVTDISGATFSCTAFQYAVWAMDTHMYTMMMDCIPQSEQGDKIRKGLLEQAKAQKEYFNFLPLITALKTYVAHFYEWDWSRRMENYSKVVGGAQRSLPAHVRHEYCNPERSFDPLPSFTEMVLPRSLKLYDWDIRAHRNWDETLQGLGTDFAVVQGGVECMCTGRFCQSSLFDFHSYVRRDLSAVSALFEVRTADLRFLQRLHTPIQKPEGASQTPTFLIS